MERVALKAGQPSPSILKKYQNIQKVFVFMLCLQHFFCFCILVLLFMSREEVEQNFLGKQLSTVRPRDTRPQDAQTLTMHVFEKGPKTFEMHVFARFLVNE